jgi:hypothetical protein
MTQPSITPKKWKRLAMGASAVCIALTGVFACALYMARMPLTDHRNLYYTLWKLGIREYDWTVTKAGMSNDHGFRESLQGLSIEEFNKTFPNTFYEMQSPPPGAKEGQTYFTDNYFASRPGGHQYGFMWIIVFEDGRLIRFGNDKGI